MGTNSKVVQRKKQFFLPGPTMNIFVFLSSYNVFLQKKILNCLRIFLFQTGVPGEIRTPDPRLRRALLYPAELLRHLFLRTNKLYNKILDYSIVFITLL